MSETGPQNLDTVVLDGNLEQVLSAEGASVNDIEEVKLTSINFMAVTDSTGATASTESFDAISGVETFISAAGLSEISIATKTSIPTGSVAFDLDVNSSADLAPYLMLPQFMLRANGTLASPITATRYVKVTVTASIKAKANL